MNQWLPEKCCGMVLWFRVEETKVINPKKGMAKAAPESLTECLTMGLWEGRCG